MKAFTSLLFHYQKARSTRPGQFVSAPAEVKLLHQNHLSWTRVFSPSSVYIIHARPSNRSRLPVLGLGCSENSSECFTGPVGTSSLFHISLFGGRVVITDGRRWCVHCVSSVISFAFPSPLWFLAQVQACSIDAPFDLPRSDPFARHRYHHPIRSLPPHTRHWIPKP